MLPTWLCPLLTDWAECASCAQIMLHTHHIAPTTLPHEHAQFFPSPHDTGITATTCATLPARDIHICKRRHRRRHARQPMPGLSASEHAATSSTRTSRTLHASPFTASPRAQDDTQVEARDPIVVTQSAFYMPVPVRRFVRFVFFLQQSDSCSELPQLL